MTANQKILKHEEIAEIAASKLKSELDALKEKQLSMAEILVLIVKMQNHPEGKRILADSHDVKSTLTAQKNRLLVEFGAHDFPQLESEYLGLVNKLHDNQAWWKLPKIDSKNFDATLFEVKRQTVLMINLITSCDQLDKEKVLPRCYFNIGRLVQCDPQFDESLSEAFKTIGVKDTNQKRGSKVGKQNKGKSISPLPKVMTFLHSQLMKGGRELPSTEESLFSALKNYREKINEHLERNQIKCTLDEGRKLRVRVSGKTYKNKPLSMRTCLDSFQKVKAGASLNSRREKRVSKK